MDGVPFYEPHAQSFAYRLCEEWSVYCHNKVDSLSARTFVRTVDSTGLMALSDRILHKNGRPLPDSVRNNPLARYLLRTRDTAAINYLLFANAAQNVKDDCEEGGWATCPLRDSVSLDRLGAVALRSAYSSRNAFLRCRYGYQLISLTFHNRRYANCINDVDALEKRKILYGTAEAAAIAFKGGALLRVGKKYNAAWCFSQSFSLSAYGKVSDFNSLRKCIDIRDAVQREQCLAFCHNQREKADMQAMLLMASIEPEEKALERLHQLYPDCPAQEMLTIREINKIECNYFSRALRRQKGGITIYTTDWVDEDTVAYPNKWLGEAKVLADYCRKLSQDGTVSHPILYASAAAYLYYITHQLKTADAILKVNSKRPASGKVHAQMAITRILLTISGARTIDSSAEARLLPAFSWLEKIGQEEGRGIVGYDWPDTTMGLYRQIYRNLLSEVLAKRYHEQKSYDREALCVAAAENMIARYHNTNYPIGAADYFLKTGFCGEQLLPLYPLLHSNKQSPWEEWLCQRFIVDKDIVALNIASGCMQESKFDEAAKWLSRIKKKKYLQIDHNPWGSLLGDNWRRSYPFDKGHFNRLSFALKMAMLSDKDRQHAATPEDLNQLANAYYNMTYYGRCWELVKAEWTMDEGYHLPDKATAFDSAYYGCYRAEAFYKKAFNASDDPNFKARCLFKMAKCAQKQLQRPAFKSVYWRWRDSVTIRSREVYEREFRTNNRYYAQLVHDYGSTAFYREAFNTCSYLRDFVRKK